MLTTAPNRISLRQNHRARNSASPEKSQKRARCATRTAVFANPQLSLGAKVVYGLMDDWAGWGGLSYPRQSTLAKQTGKSRQSVQRWVAELEAAGWIVRVERAGRAITYALKWASEAHGRASHLVNHPVCTYPVAAPVPPEPPVELSTPAEDCSHCGGTGDRAYHVPAQIGAGGRRIAARSWRGSCGCGQGKAIMREYEKRGSSDA
jgi:hypothetical protein